MISDFVFVPKRQTIFFRATMIRNYLLEENESQCSRQWSGNDTIWTNIPRRLKGNSELPLLQSFFDEHSKGINSTIWHRDTNERHRLQSCIYNIFDTLTMVQNLCYCRRAHRIRLAGKFCNPPKWQTNAGLSLCCVYFAFCGFHGFPFGKLLGSRSFGFGFRSWGGLSDGFVESRVGFLVSIEVGGVKIQSGDGTLAF